MLTDADRIRNLLARYGELLDAGDFDGVGALFAHGSLCGPDGTPFAAGAAEVAAFYRAGTQLHDGSPRTKHLVVNPIVEEPDEAGAVTVRSSYVVLQATDALALQPIISGRYVDRFAPDGADGWAFAERRFFVDQVGDLSQHLADPTLADARSEEQP
ncbi:MAG: nuclear transport factor 2 family protein [Acidimicrobiales bacterium]